MYSIKSVKEIQDLNPFIVVGCGGGGEKFSNLEGVETVGFIDDNVKKQGKEFCGYIVAGSLDESLKHAKNAKSLVIMLPIGAEGSALKYAVQAIDAGLNVITSFRSLSITENISLKKFADAKGVVIKDIGPRLDVVKTIAGVAPKKSCEVLPKISYESKAPVIFVGGTSQECGKRTTTKKLGIASMKRGLTPAIISTDEMGLEEPTDFNFRAGSLSAMDVPAAVLSAIKYAEETKQPDIIFIEGQSSLTEKGNPHPRGLSAAILIGAAPDAVIVGHRPNHPYREPRGIEEEIRAIEAVEPTKVVGLSINLKNADLDLCPEFFESKYNLPAEDVYNNGADKLLDAIFEYLGE
ncbi:Uncharacterized conserved protein, NAD-dependent epimerase/dehydratase family [Methanobrevibacter gottschalkii]|uniref:Uncharacterized conserved protein, NAD-dependent epimerase/dehydratase family n=2 Tax=Methanobrevibacter gottschalkii TaxID=190974 RepID=A0A1H7MK23_9EURY|nr:MULTISPECIES: DUF1611 domain-containing protein [Methanobrevibacter]MCQ2970367.1 DUF1611 domain-containing protein [archaeon]OEC94488.1 hypothetical protein A9505_08660 [Methanobrevibacter sp. A27]RPF50173.1 putative NAD-dependent epimerase/dehydratase family protein [Methanobrevibacter gottschalkii DSM 11977]SEL11419.1 Uncharacterized conserved protein, NAD-dependent epimerase/dehydratase family [Methanobrevibacter gottschalkii]